LADADANNALLRQVKEELPDYISNILLFAPDGSNIGISWNSDRRFYAGDRAYFQQVIAGQRLAIGDVIRTKLTGEWVVTLASPVKDQNGRLRGVIAIGTKLDRFQDALRTQTLPAGSIVRILNEKGIVVAQSDNGQEWIGRNLSGSDDVAEMLAQKESSAVMPWPDRVKRITGSARAHRIPWVVSVGLPTNVGQAAMMAHLTLGEIFSGLSLLAGIAIAWMLSPHYWAIAAIATRCTLARERRSYPPNRGEDRRRGRQPRRGIQPHGGVHRTAAIRIAGVQKHACRGHRCIAGRHRLFRSRTPDRPLESRSREALRI
jgi:hypothetical protein